MTWADDRRLSYALACHWLMLFAIAAGTISPAATYGQTDDRVSFARDILPILSNSCFTCHGPDAAERQADLRLDLESSAHVDAIQPGDAEASPIIERITDPDPEQKMPPPGHGHPLTQRHIELIRRWFASR